MNICIIMPVERDTQQASNAIALLACCIILDIGWPKYPLTRAIAAAMRGSLPDPPIWVHCKNRAVKVTTW